MVVGVSETFSAAHFIPGHWKCGRVHGHNFRVEVEVEGDLRNGMVMDFYELKKILREIVERYDHGLLNDHFENPTSENICVEIFSRLRERGSERREGKGERVTGQVGGGQSTLRLKSSALAECVM